MVNAALRFGASLRSSIIIAGLLSGMLLVAAPRADAGSRVIVSATLNSTLQFFDSETYAELQPPLPSRGGGPVRLWVGHFDGKPYLFAANHGVVTGSLGVFDLSGPVALELPLSPFPTTRPGSVGVVAGTVKAGAASVPMAFVTNTFFALGGCSMPTGSVTAFDLSLLGTAGLALPAATVDVSGPIPYAVSLDGDGATAYVSNNCARVLDSIAIGASELAPGAPRQITLTKGAARPLGSGPDGTLFDASRGRSYTVNISGGSLTVYDTASTMPLTTVPLKKGNGGSVGSIDANLADTTSGRALIVTSNGSDDSVSVIDRDTIEHCIAGNVATCGQAEVGRISTAVPGGAPEGIDYDPATNRIFTVNKTIAAPSLSVIQLDPISSTPGAAVTGADVHQIPIAGVDAAAPVPALIAFDVVVQK